MPNELSGIIPNSSLDEPAMRNQGVVGRVLTRHVGLKPDLRSNELSGLIAHARFDEGGQARACLLLYRVKFAKPPDPQPTEGAANQNPALMKQLMELLAIRLTKQKTLGKSLVIAIPLSNQKTVAKWLVIQQGGGGFLFFWRNIICYTDAIKIGESGHAHHQHVLRNSGGDVCSRYEQTSSSTYPYEFKAVLKIPGGEVLEGELPSRQMKLVQAWIELHQDDLMAD